MHARFVLVEWDVYTKCVHELLSGHLLPGKCEDVHTLPCRIIWGDLGSNVVNMQRKLRCRFVFSSCGCILCQLLGRFVCCIYWIQQLHQLSARLIFERFGSFRDKRVLTVCCRLLFNHGIRYCMHRVRCRHVRKHFRSIVV